jgi:inner membrane protein
MDSVTQIVLGAACGEAVAGKKIGNRAMLWGAIGGTIPDLDVLARLFTDEITATSFHRGFMHSMLFAALAPWGLAWLVRLFYSSNIHRLRGYKIAAGGIWLLLFLLAAVGINAIPMVMGASFTLWVFMPTFLLGTWMAWRLWKDYWTRDLPDVEASYLTWVSLFFWSVFTHPILDCFTQYGTQIWQPFSDERIAWSTISIVDPLYTVPFALSLIALGWFHKTSATRRVLVWLGIVWSCSYLAFTVWHKQQFNRVFEKSFEQKGIAYNRFTSNPSIFNNVVWFGVAESDTAYYFGMYGFNDKAEDVRPISVLPKNHELLSHIPEDDRAYRFLRWFSKGYYNVLPYTPDTLMVNDLRFGLMGDTLLGDNYVFRFRLYKNDEGNWDVIGKPGGGDDPELARKSFGTLWQRIKGER